ncbi:hypothetical protein GCM10025879_05350 [Leuconostoc litchii]|uniref:hypothetical protein n=1 Tax=Leuconostoc litchii TaxID=1981069 RepID=UPI0023E99F00|nr:hypothetical protein [Leuconostoc litchii]GMA69289.1 hypothetical protein GCM10025879_05350 [Leuconostoc litchii]
MTDSQTALQPELINQLDSKIMYLGQLQSAIMNQQLPQVYELLDSKNLMNRFDNVLMRILTPC